MASKERTRCRLKLRFIGEGFRDGHVPITILAEKLEALQSLVFHAAANTRHEGSARRGQWFSKYRDVAELEFHSAHHSNLVIESELARPEGWLEGMADAGSDALNQVFLVASQLQQPEGITRILPDRTERAFLLRSLERLCPNLGDEYSIELDNCIATHPKAEFSASTRKDIRRMLAEPEAEQRQATIVGTLVKIHVEVGPNMIAVQLGTGQEISCFYDESMRDQISNLLAGSMVEVTGLATLDSAGAIRQLDSVLDVETVSMEPVRLVRFVCRNSIHALRHPIQVAVERTGDLWVYNCASINLWGVGERREDALSDLNENFDFLWREYAQEEDSVLDAKALELKRKLLELRD
jgi:hypothetical protein